MTVRDATLHVLDEAEARLRNEMYHAAQTMDCKKTMRLNERWHKIFRLKCGLVDRSMTVGYVHAVLQAAVVRLDEKELMNNIKKLTGEEL